jgi:citrate lyase subunit beta/citryl-CoA lyase
LTVAAARLAGLFALDGVCNALQDAAALEAECRQGRAFGFDGKTLIHPAQIETTNRLFSPSEAALNHARAVLAAFAAPENHSQGVVRVDGKMVERLHLAQAERVVALAQAAAREPG